LYPRKKALTRRGAYVLQEANGVCECCEVPAPFSRTNGSPYLEVHRVKQLSDDGPDTTDNAVALCPNCHREIHHGGESVRLKRRLYFQVGRLVKP
jgi:5-methylcytosine-specific restriction protein A